ncbi:MAG TPA: SDR family oxidoreductase, partial [Acidimicrobiia bacterium]|nr:SDR family oxidoreductase [Acidimicrobiia bacterium]
GSGIGRASALALARAGARPVIADIDAERASAVEHEARNLGVEAAGIRCDVTSDDDFEVLRRETLARFGRVDIVMNNASIIPIGRPETLPMDAWQRCIDVNLLSIVRSLRVLLPLLIEQGSGHVVNTASTAGLMAYAYERLPYSATKSAVVGLSEALALYTRPLGVGVTCLCPGPVATNITEQFAVHDDVPINSPTGLEVLDPAVVGDLVVDAVRANTFLLLTHPQVHEMLVARAEDPESFLAARLAEVARP